MSAKRHPLPQVAAIIQNVCNRLSKSSSPIALVVAAINDQFRLTLDIIADRPLLEKMSAQSAATPDGNASTKF